MEQIYNKWIIQYLTEQEKKNPKVIYELFDKDGVYWWGPFNSPRHGVEAIYAHHKNALSHQEEIHYEYELLAVNEMYGLAKFKLRLKDLMPNEPNAYEGIFQVFLNDTGKCVLFKEWYNFASV